MRTATTESVLDRSPVVDVPRNAAPNLSWWATTADAWDEVELDPKLMAPVRAALERHAAFKADRAYAHDRATSAIAELRRAIARGETTFDEAAARLPELSALEQLADPRGTDAAAGRVLAADLTTTMRKTGDALITKHLAPAYAALVDEARQLAPHVDGITTEPDAMRAAPAVRDAWARLIFLATRRRLLCALARRLRREAILTASRAGALEAEYEYRRPELAASDRHDVPSLVALVTSDADPALLTAAEVDELEAARTEPIRQPKKPTPIVRRDGSLIGGSAA